MIEQPTNIPKGEKMGESEESSTMEKMGRSANHNFLASLTRSQLNLHVLTIGVFYILLIALFALTTPLFLTIPNARNILANTSVLGIVALGQAFVLIGGGFDLSVGGTVPLGAIVFTLLVNSNWGVAPAAIITVLMGAFIGLLNAIIITKVGIAPMITTLGTLSITKALAFIMSSGVNIPFRNASSGFLARTYFGGIVIYIWAFILLCILSHIILRYTLFGRMVFSVGGNREASRLAGIRVDMVHTYLYMLCAGLAAFSGVLTASQLLLGSATVGSEAPLTSIAAVILGGATLTGGVGGVPGTVLGILIMGTLANGMALMHVRAFYQEMATGIMLLGSVGLTRARSILFRRNR
jgi:ribose transport system permease protein